MSKSPTQEQFNSLKQQYDQLLDKNQDDLIKIKQKQKTINAQLSKIKQQSEEKEQALNSRIKQLQDSLTKQRQSKPGQKDVLKVQVVQGTSRRVQELEIDIRRLIDQNINLTADCNTLTVELQQLRLDNEKLIHQSQRLSTYIESLEKQRANQLTKVVHDACTTTIQPLIRQEHLASLQKQINQKDSQLSRLAAQNKQLIQELRSSRQETKTLHESEKRYMKLLKKKDSDLSAMSGEITKLKIALNPRKRTQQLQVECQKCNSFKQQIELLKQMVKSTQGMVRVKEIQNSKYKIHHGQETVPNQSKSMLKPQDKTPPLPPLRKK